ncbi:MAG: DUF3857 domain-containing protein [Hyphomicrobiaceae bacterium]
MSWQAVDRIGARVPLGLAMAGLALALLVAGIGGIPARAQQAWQAPPQAREVSVAASAFAKGLANPAWVLQPEDSLPAADTKPPVVVRLADTQFRVDDTPVVWVRRAVQVNDATMLTATGEIAIGFVPEYQRLVLHHVAIVRGGERIERTAEVTPRFLQRANGYDRALYTDEITASILVSDLRVGDTIDYAYSVSGQNPVFGGKFVNLASWDGPSPVVRRRVIVDHPVARTIRWNFTATPKSAAVAPTITDEAGRRRLVFEQVSFAEVVPELQLPPDVNPYRWIELSEFENWQDVASWAVDLFKSDGVVDGEFKQLIDRIKAAPTPEQRIVKALEIVQTEIRYFSVALGENSHRPASPSDVLKRRFGDCKDKSRLLVTLLGALGIEAGPVLLSAGRRKGLDTALASPLAFDHAIVRARLGKADHYLDPARIGQHGQLGNLGNPYADHDVLLVAPETKRLVRLPPPSTTGRATSEMVEEMRLADLAGVGEITTRRIWRGLGAEALRVAVQQMSLDRIARSFGDDMIRRYPKAEAVGEPQLVDDRERNTLTITQRFKVPGLATQEKQFWIIPIRADNVAGTFNGKPSPRRTWPVAIESHPRHARYRLEVTLPETVGVRLDPHAYAVRDKHFSYEIAGTYRGNVATRTITIRTLTDRVAPADVAAFNEKLDKAGHGLARAVVVPKVFIRKGKVAKSYERTYRERTEAEFAAATRALRSGKLAGEKLALVACARSTANINLGRPADGLKDAERAIKAQPAHGLTSICLGEAQVASGDFAGAVGTFSKAIALAGNERERHLAHLGRAHAALYGNDFARAAGDYEIAASIAPDDAERLNSTIWLAVALRRMGKPLPEALQQAAGDDADGDWPRPVLAMLAGKLAPEKLLAALDAMSGERKHLSSVEGFYYLAQHYLASGDATLARAYLERTRSLKVIGYQEHTAAGHALKALAAASAQSAQPATSRTAPLAVVETGSLTPAAATPATATATVAAPKPIAAKPAPEKPRRKPARRSGAPASKAWSGEGAFGRN